jgi:hypothetical protein
MQTARQTLLEFLATRGKRVAYREVERALTLAGVLGLGVEPIDVVDAAARDKKVLFDPTSGDLVLLDRQ